MTETSEQAGTRERIIDVAGALFAAQGFRGATIRDICGQAGVNVAAVNYYFRDKESLYAEVLQHAHRYCEDKYPLDMGVPEGGGPEERLAGFVRSFLRRIVDVGRPSWHWKLVAMEMADPTPALDVMVEQSVRPMFSMIVAIMRELAGPDTSEREAVRYASSVVGQVLFYRHARAVIERLGVWNVNSEAELDALARHIVAFSLGGLARVKEGSGPNE